MLQQKTIEFRCSFTRTWIAVNLTVGQEYVAGSGDDNEIILQGQDILSQHAKLILSLEGLCITPIKQSCISVNGSPINDSTILTDGDWLSLGFSLFQINFPNHPHTPTQNIQTLGSERKQHQGRIPLAKLLPWMRQLCEVLIYLHSQDPPIIHRDLKPDNILLDENGRIMLIDFGIAKEAKPATMTRTIGRAATHGFSPPEQAMGTDTDERSDIYSLAATFYTLLTGKNPPAAHERVSGKEIIPPSQFVPDISSQLEATLLQVLSLNVNHRQQTVKEFSQTLDMIASGTNDTKLTTEYSERTVMISKTIGVTDTTGTHPASIKLPSGRISIEKSNTLSTPAPAAQQHSKRNAIILLSVIFIIFAALLAVYLFWFKTAPETKEAVIIVPTSSVSIVEPSPKKVTPENNPPADIPSGKNSTTGTAIKEPTVSGTAQDALRQGQQDKDNPAEPISLPNPNPPKPPKIIRKWNPLGAAGGTVQSPMTVSITINQLPGENSEELAERIMAKIEQKQQLSRRGKLHD